MGTTPLANVETRKAEVLETFRDCAWVSLFLSRVPRTQLAIRMVGGNSGLGSLKELPRHNGFKRYCGSGPEPELAHLAFGD